MTVSRHALAALLTLALVALPAAWAQPAENVTSTPIPSGDRVGSPILVRMSIPKEVLKGQDFVHSITLTNLTSKPLTGVTLKEDLPENYAVQAAAPQAAISGRTLSWTIGVLGAQESKMVRVKGSATATGAIVPCCRVTFDLPKVCVTTRVVQPALRLVKTAPAEVIVCDPIPMVFTVTNTGTGTATNVRITDTLPAGMKTLDGLGSISFNVGSLAPGETRKLTASTKVSQPGSYVNTATAVADNGLTASSGKVTTIARLPVLQVTKTGPGLRYVGRPGTYTITVMNKGDAPAKDTVLVDTIPAGAKFLSASAGGQAAGDKVTWNLGTIAPKSAKQVTVGMNFNQIGVMRNIATATAYCAKASGQHETVVKGIPAILLECVDTEDPVEVGATTVYSIRVTNQGSAVGTNIVVTCVLPKEMQFVTGKGPTKGTVQGQTIQFAPLSALRPKAQATYNITAKGIAEGDVRFRVSLKSDQMTVPADETESTTVYK